jgi:hypothetical protein
MILRFQKQRKVAYGIYFATGMYRQDVPKGGTLQNALWGGALQEWTYGQLRQQSNSKIYEKLMDHGAIDEDTKFIDLGSGTMMVSAYGSRQAGHRGRERDRLVMGGSLITTLSSTLMKAKPPTRLACLEADIGLMISL